MLLPCCSTARGSAILELEGRIIKFVKQQFEETKDVFSNQVVPKAVIIEQNDGLFYGPDRSKGRPYGLKS